MRNGLLRRRENGPDKWDQLESPDNSADPEKSGGPPDGARMVRATFGEGAIRSGDKIWQREKRRAASLEDSRHGEPSDHILLGRIAHGHLQIAASQSLDRRLLSGDHFFVRKSLVGASMVKISL